MVVMRPNTAEDSRRRTVGTLAQSWHSREVAARAIALVHSHPPRMFSPSFATARPGAPTTPLAHRPSSPTIVTTRPESARARRLRASAPQSRRPSSARPSCGGNGEHGMCGPSSPPVLPAQQDHLETVLSSPTRPHEAAGVHAATPWTYLRSLRHDALPGEARVPNRTAASAASAPAALRLRLRKMRRDQCHGQH